MFYNEDIFNRTLMMLNENQKQNLFSKSIIVFGVGGVGGALVHMLVRSGIHNVSVVDFDKIDITNINRQLVAYQNKLEELNTRLEEPNLKKDDINRINKMIKKASAIIEHASEVSNDIKALLNNESVDTILGIRPEDISLSLDKLDNYYEVKVDVSELLGKEQIVHFDINEQELLANLSAKYEVSMGDALYVSLDNKYIHIFDKESEETIF